MNTPKNRGRRRGSRTVMALILSLVLLAALLYGADYVFRARVEAQLAGELREALPQVSQDLDVQIDGALFLPQLISGRVDSAQVSAEELQVDAFTAHDVQVHLRGVHLREPYRIEYLQIEGLAAAPVLRAMLISAGIPEGVRIDLVVSELIIRGEVLGVPWAATLIPEAQGRSIAITVDAVELGGTRIEVTDLPDVIVGWLTDLQVELSDLPEPLLLDHLDVRRDGVVLRVVGTDVMMEDL